MRGAWVSTAVGIVIGLALGWVLFTEPARERRAAAPAGTRPAAPPEAREAATPPVEGTAAEDPRSEPTPKGKQQVALEVLSGNLEQAHAAKDWRSFRGVLKELGARNTPEADALLVAVMADLSMRFPDDRMGRHFEEWLKGSEAAGIAHAARARMQQSIEAGRKGWSVPEGWAELIAEHGDAADLEWLLAVEELGPHNRVRWRILLALAKSSRPEVVAGLLPILRKGESAVGGDVLKAFVRANPAQGYELLDQLVARADTQRGKLARYSKFSGAFQIETSDVGQMLAEATTAERLERTRERLLTVENPGLRLDMVYAVQRLADRKLDVSGLEPILEGPIEILNQMVAGGEDSSGLASSARYAIEYNKLMWHKRSIEALERAAAVSPKWRERFLVVANEVRGNLAGEWKTE